MFLHLILMQSNFDDFVFFARNVQLNFSYVQRIGSYSRITIFVLYFSEVKFKLRYFSLHLVICHSSYENFNSKFSWPLSNFLKLRRIFIACAVRSNWK